MITDNGLYLADSCYQGENGMLNFLAAGETALNALRGKTTSDVEALSLDQIQLLAPVIKPGKVFGVGLNYADHIAETGRDKPEYPTFFNKQNTCVTGTGSPIHRPKVSDKLDYEGELAIVIGKRCRHVSEKQASSVIAGFTIMNDVSVRDWQMRSHTWTLGKSFDTHGPSGPWIITADEIRRSAASDLSGVLKYRGGVEVWQHSLGSADVSVRGYNQGGTNRLLVLVNGRQVYLDHFGLVSWNSIPVELNEIRQIEIVKGPNTALFGFNAVGGVVNIVTYNPLLDDVDRVSALRVRAPCCLETSLDAVRA